MKIRILHSAVDGPAEHQFATSYLVNDSVAIDAGCLGYADLDDQKRVRHLLLSHSHADHLATLAVFIENVYDPATKPVTVWGSDAVLESLRADVFNDRVFPNFLDGGPPGPFLTLRRIAAEVAVEVEALEVVPVPMDHTVPTLGFVVRDAGATVLIASDTGPTARVWEIAAALPALSAVFLEASFPDRMGDVAAASRHLTPATFSAEVAKLGREVPIIAVHIKAPYREETIAELRALGIAGLEIGIAGKAYEFS